MVQFSEDLAEAAQLNHANPSADAARLLALELFREDKISLGRAVVSNARRLSFSARIRQNRNMYDSPRNAQILQAVSRASERSSAAVHQDFSRGVNSLAMISSVAPLLGIFGTVLDIENSFLGVGAEKSAILAAVFERLSLAFIPTALGLLVGLLAFWCYKYLTAELEAFDLEMKNASGELGNRDSVFCIFSMLT